MPEFAVAKGDFLGALTCSLNKTKPNPLQALGCIENQLYRLRAGIGGSPSSALAQMENRLDWGRRILGRDYNLSEVLDVQPVRVWLLGWRQWGDVLPPAFIVVHQRPHQPLPAPLRQLNRFAGV